MSVKKGTSHINQIHRLNRASGQLQGLIKMIESRRYCVDILTQLKALKAALSSVERQIIQEHLNHCVLEAVTSKDQDRAKEMVEEISQLLKATRSA